MINEGRSEWIDEGWMSMNDNVYDEFEILVTFFVDRGKQLFLRKKKFSSWTNEVRNFVKKWINKNELNEWLNRQFIILNKIQGLILQQQFSEYQRVNLQNQKLALPTLFIGTRILTTTEWTLSFKTEKTN